MAVDPTKLPLQTFLAVTNAGATIDLGQVFGAIYLRNSDAANPLWFTLGAGAVAPVVPAAANGAGCTRLGFGESLNLDDIAVRFITARTAVATTAGIQIVAYPRPGN